MLRGPPRGLHGLATPLEGRLTEPSRARYRGTNENTNGLIGQYLPKRASMAHVTQHDCNAIAKRLNTRPRKTYDDQRRSTGQRCSAVSFSGLLGGGLCLEHLRFELEARCVN